MLVIISFLKINVSLLIDRPNLKIFLKTQFDKKKKNCDPKLAKNYVWHRIY
jgi:hypothetical protein